jgi:TonB family protein
MRIALVMSIAGALLFPQSTPEPYRPARYLGGGPPGLAPMAVGGGEVVLEVSVASTGRVENIKPIRTTPPFTQMLVERVRGWRFAPATEDPLGPDGKPAGRRAVASKVLVAALFRAPTLLTPTQGETPATVSAASNDVVYPSQMIEPPFPPDARFGGVVMIEARIGPTGIINEARVIASSPPFDEPAMQAARQWRFYPAQIKDNADSFAYLVFGFPQPVTGR